MAITLSQLCANTEKKYSMKLIAGHAGMGNTVRWVHIIEDSEVPDFLHGNELIFTTGIGHVGNEWLKSFTVSLKNKGAIGLVVNIGPYISSVPSQAIVFCEQNGFPLFTIPWKTRIIDISYEFCRRIIANEKRESTIADAFRGIIRNPATADDYSSMLNRAGFYDDSSYTVISLSILRKSVSITESVVRTTDMSLWRMLKKSGNHSSLFMKEGDLVAVRQNCSEEEIVMFCELLRPIAEQSADTEIYIGVSESLRGFVEISQAYEQSYAAMLTGRIKGKEHVFYRDIGLMKLIFGVKDKMILSSFAEENLGVLHRYDSEKNTDYCSVLRKYLELNGSVLEAAAETGVHRNTINYKIRAIREILGRELDDHTKSMLMLAYLIEDVLDIYDNLNGGNKQ